MGLNEIFIMIGMLTAAFGVAALNDWTKRRAVEKAAARGKKAKARWKNNRTPRSEWIWYLIGIPLVLLGVAALRASPRLAAWFSYAWLPVVCIAPFAWVLLRRWRMRHATRAQRLAREGDIDGAIRDLQQRLQSHPHTPSGWETIGLLHMQQEDWPAALAALDRVPKGPILCANKALVYWRLGERETADALLVEARKKIPGMWLFACNHAELLADMGRLDEAREAFQAAETLAGGIWIPAQRRVSRECLDRCRQRLDEAASR